MRRFTLPVAAILTLVAGACGHKKGGGAPVESTLTTGNLPFDTVKLVPADLSRPAPLMRALKERRSVRQYNARPLTLRQLSELLWAANGVNRDDGKRTAPAAQNQQIVDVYVVLPVGVFLYDAPGQRLLPVAAGDNRKTTGTEDWVTTAPANLVYVADPARLTAHPGDPEIPEKLNWARIAVGAQAQNVGLYCAGEQLGNVVRAVFGGEKLGAALKLRPDQLIILAQTIGNPKS